MSILHSGGQRLAVVVLYSGLAITAIQAVAQTSATSAERSSFAVEEIVVTARRREERLQDVPAAVTAFDEAALARYAVTDFTGISNLTSQLTINSGGASSGSQLYIRGIGSSGDLGFDQAVGIVIDDVFYNRGRWVQQSFMDMARVEVLKGPQPLYFGKNTPAGVVVVTTADPGDTFEAYVTGSYEFEAEEWIGQGVISSPITDNFGARLAVRFTDARGWMENIAQERPGASALGFTIPAPNNRWNSSDELTGRLTLKWEPSDDFDLTFKAQASRFENAGQNQQSPLIICRGPNNSPQAIFGVEDPFSPCQRGFKLAKADFPIELARNAQLDFNDGVAVTKYKSHNLSLRANYDTGDYLFTSVTGYNFYQNKPTDSQDYSAIGLLWTGDIGEHEAFTQEFRVLTQFDSSVNFMLGAFYQETDFDYVRTTRLIPVPADPANNDFFSWFNTNNQDGRSWSAFGEVIWNVTEQVEVSAGARYTHEKKKSDSINNYIHPALTAVFSDQLFEDTFTDSEVSPQITVTWMPTDSTTLFAGYKTGFKAGGFSHTGVLVAATTLDALTFDSETVEGFEIGARTRAWDDRLRLDGVIYRYVYDDLQVSAFNADTTSFTLENAAKATARGAELEIGLAATPALQLRANIAYNKSRYDDFLGPCYAGQTQEGGCNQVINPNTGLPTSQDLSGRQTILSPDWNGRVGFSYSAPVLDRLMLDVSSDLRFSSGYPLMTENRPGMRQGSYTVLDAAIRLSSMEDTWELALIGRNLTNKAVFINGTDRPLTGGAPGLPAGAPGAGIESDGFAIVQRKRQLVAQLTYRF